MKTQSGGKAMNPNAKPFQASLCVLALLIDSIASSNDFCMENKLSQLQS